MNNNLAKLINNGFDFLEKAIDQFQKEPKFSVINFCIATELFLKARLMKEHWSLVVTGNPDIVSFRKGDFKSINFKDIIPKIEAITGEKFEQDVKVCFNGLANHRNKMVHFYHDISKGESDKQIEQIVIEQCNGWHFLRSLLEKWHEIFTPYQEKIFHVNNKMKRHNVYLKTVYKNMLPEIKLATSKGIVFANCGICHNRSSEITKLTEYLYACRCRVCHFSDEYLRVVCPQDDCDGIIKIDGFSIGQTAYFCPECEYELSQESLSDMLDGDPRTYDDYVDHINMNCAECGVADEVIRHDNYYICLSCLYVDGELNICGWCNEGQIGGGDLEFSGVTGCSFCDGSAAWYKDD